ncbi:polysaccharide deacetylase family protein [Absiella sp. AM29-15]|uniref:polysaccharide deacetylase family protein n=1 Tax=Absiella sp. AM29-15 TaxID=2292278 RepID=UPI001314DD87|nr:polysaccharide deacetylase family protein [Absiella sp. AM29-15]
MYEKAKKRNIKILIALLCLAVIAGSYGIYVFMTKDPYKAYTAYKEDNKKAGTMKHEVQDEEKFYLSVYYPVFDNEVLDQAVSAYRNDKIQSDLKQNSKIIINVDYDSYDIFDSYISIAFHQTLMDEDGHALKTTTSTINYDKKQNKIMETKDVLRRDYMSLLRNKAKDANVDVEKVTKNNTNNFIIGEKEVRFLYGNSMDRMITIPYDENKEYIALTNPNIPSLYQKEAIVPKQKDQNIDPNKPMIAFTFDDGPSDLTLKLMDAFDKYDANATFFMVGPNVERRSDVVKEMYARGFQLGNHTWTHEKELTRLTHAQLMKEIYDTQDAIFKACGHDADYLRPPYGSYDTNVLKASIMPVAYWGVDSEDWKSRNVDSIKKEILKSVFDGAIILEHDIYGTSVDAAIELLPELKAKGYQIVSLDTLMKYRGDKLTKTSYITPSLYE